MRLLLVTPAPAGRSFNQETYLFFDKTPLAESWVCGCTCIMTQVSKRVPATPKQAAQKIDAIDRAIDVELFKALGDRTRAKLLACLAKCSRACSVTEVAECCDIDFSVVSRHLSLLARAGVLEVSKAGRVVSYKVRYDGISSALRELADAFERCGNESPGPSCCR